MTRRFSLLGLATPLVVLGLGLGRGATDVRAGGRDEPSTNCGTRAARHAPLAFEENRGQTDSRVRFLARNRGLTAFLCPTEAVFALYSGVQEASRRDQPFAEDASARTEVVRMRFVGANGTARVEGADPLPGKSNYLIGNDRSRWVTGAPTYGRVVVREPWPGIDVVWRGDENGRLTYDLVVGPGANPRAIEVELEGAVDVVVASDGTLRATTELGELLQSRPIAFQTIDGTRRLVDVAFQTTGDRHIRFDVGEHDEAHALVIDPSLTYSTYLGGSALDAPIGITVDETGAVYVCGNTQSADFPVHAAYQSTGAGGTAFSAFVTKLDAAGSSIVFSTYLAGTQGYAAAAHAVAVDGDGAVYLAGNMGYTDFPTQNAFQSSHGGNTYDAFITKLDSSGSALVYSTYLGGSSNDVARSLAIDGNGAAYVSGYVRGSSGGNFPTQGALQAFAGGGGDAFVAKLSSSGSSLAYSTYLGGNGDDSSNGIAVDSAGAAYVAGTTTSSDFPTQSALQSGSGGSGDAFVTKVNASGSALTWSTYLGGSDGEDAMSVAVDSNGAAYVAGRATSTNFPTQSALQPSNAGGARDAFVTKFAANGQSLAWSTYLGGSSSDIAYKVAVDASGAVVVFGATSSSDFPTASASQPGYGGGPADAFLSSLSSDGSTLTFSTFLGGSGNEPNSALAALALDSTGAAYATGSTTSADFPVQSAFQSGYAGGGDGFVVKFPTGSGSPPPTPAPAAPTNLVAEYTEGVAVSLSWSDAATDETGFQVERKAQGYSFATLMTTAANTASAADTSSLYPKTTYTYRVRAFNAGGSSAWSNEASVTTGTDLPVPAPPAAPSLLTAAPLEDGTIWLMWKDNSPHEVGFSLVRTEGGASFEGLGYPKPNVTSWIDGSVHPGWPMSYRVAALSPLGPSQWSNTARATVPATLRVTVTSGKLVNSPRPRHDKVRKLVAGFAPAPTAIEASFNPVVGGLELQFGPADAPLAVSIAPGDPDWTEEWTKPRKGKPSVVKRAMWKRTEKGASPKAKITVDFVRQTIVISAWNFDFTAAPTTAVRLLVASGADGGGHEAEWEQGKAGKFSFPLK